MALHSSFLSAVGVRQQNLPANGKQGLVPKEMSQTLLANKRLGKPAGRH
jgi:hypothetical protein